MKDLKVCELMDKHIGEEHGAKVERVTGGGVKIFVPEFNITGFIPKKRLGTGRIKLNGPNITFEADRRHYSITEGEQIDVRIAECDFDKLLVEFDLVSARSYTPKPGEEGKATSRRSPKKGSQSQGKATRGGGSKKNKKKK